MAHSRRTSKVRPHLTKTLLQQVHARDVARRESLPRFGELSPSLWNTDVDPNGQLCIGGWPAKSLVEEFGSPLHVVDESRLLDNYRSFRKAFEDHYPRIDIGYSYKTNPLPGALQLLHQAGASAEVVSEFELWLAQSLNVPPERIILGGPGKTRACLDRAVSMGVKIINVDGLDEIDRIQELAAKHRKVQSVALRVFASVGWGASTQFGVSLARDALDAFRKMKERCSNIDPAALHIHLGTGLQHAPTYFEASRELLDFGVELERSLGITLRSYNIGGGFGVPTVKPYSEEDEGLLSNGLAPTVLDPEAAPATDEYACGIGELFSEYIDTRDPDCPEIVVEPGRAISSSAQSLLVEVLSTKEDDDRRVAVVDGGKENVGTPLGSCWDEHHETLPASNMSDPLEWEYDVVGPLCHPDDFLTKAKRFPRLAPGDVLAVMDAGAYFVPNQRNFSYRGRGPCWCRPAASGSSGNGKPSRTWSRWIRACDHWEVAPMPPEETNPAPWGQMIFSGRTKMLCEAGVKIERFHTMLSSNAIRSSHTMRLFQIETPIEIGVSQLNLE